MPAGDFALKINVGMSGRLKMARVILVLTTTGKDSHPNTYYTYIVCVCVCDFSFVETSPEVAVFSTGGFGHQVMVLSFRGSWKLK